MALGRGVPPTPWLHLPASHQPKAQLPPWCVRGGAGDGAQTAALHTTGGWSLPLSEIVKPKGINSSLLG